MKQTLVALVLTTFLAICFPGFAFAFHEGGVGSCEGCHTNHNSQDNFSLDGAGSVGSAAGNYLLLGSDPSSVCLNCHQGTGSYGVFSAGGSAMKPAGDFYWLTRTFTWIGSDGLTHTSKGERHGHNIVALDYGLEADTTYLQSPGGTYPAEDLSCISCHDPHGQISGAPNSSAISGSGSYGAAAPQDNSILGNYRILGGNSYNGGLGSSYSFAYPAPIAAAPSGDYVESDNQHAAYGSGISEWCANCHKDYLDGLNGHHLAGNAQLLTSTMLTQYNAYVATGDLTGANETAYLAFVPFATGDTDPSLLDPLSTAGPNSGASVHCLTCHRAHGSAFANIGRWDFNVELLIDSHPDGATDGSTSAEKLYSYYNRDIATEFGSEQRQFCQKCHSNY